ncbi:hypothetical protein [Natronolimnobius baerhuensis]|uniref:TRAM domain-containing protein n=1 Tax=Natronolimnobius baerhuensis TaxID=253108 RepID=A0A202E822_9EURY|nr:hypothetical protein [Natronolimnobius baerhuensis]OVE84379.1 hypothetical protein B2G88_08165 [Natronolimnobius baerhuensis]
MTSLRDLLAESLAIGETVPVKLEQTDDGEALVAAHPRESSPLDIVIVDGEELLEEWPPTEPVAVEIIGEVVDGRVAGRIVESA